MSSNLHILHSLSRIKARMACAHRVCKHVWDKNYRCPLLPSTCRGDSSASMAATARSRLAYYSLRSVDSQSMVCVALQSAAIPPSLSQDSSVSRGVCEPASLRWPLLPSVLKLCGKQSRRLVILALRAVRTSALTQVGNSPVTSSFKKAQRDMFVSVSVLISSCKGRLDDVI